MISDKNEQQLLRELTLENKRLLTENNQLLKKLQRWGMVNFWLKLIWTFIFLGIPFVLYYYVVEPYFDSMGSSFSTFQEGLQEIPGWKQFYEASQHKSENVD